MGLAAFVEERFLVRTCSSPKASVWIAAHRLLSLPFYLSTTARVYVGRRGDGDVKIVAVGRPKRFLPLLRRLFEDVQEVERTRRTAWGPESFDDTEADLVVSEVHRWVAPRFRSAGWLIMPDSIRWAGDAEALPPAFPCRSLREDLKKVRRYDYALQQSTAWADWEEFYETMLLPQAVSRFGEAAWLPSRRFLRELWRRGTLHLLFRDGQWVAGSCSVRNGDTLWLPLTGMLDGSPRLLHEGVFVALISKTFAWARTQGYRRIDGGRTTPFVQDGVPKNKAKWGYQAALDPLSHLLALRVGPSPHLREGFAAQPIVLEMGAGTEVYCGG
jgi:Acetyltransferase (GNAT) domain